MKTYATVEDLDVTNKRVLVRTGYDVPIEHGKVQDTTRIRTNMPTIEYLLKKNAKVIIITHLGRPGGKITQEFSLKLIVEELKKYLPKGTKAVFLDECIGEKITQHIAQMRPGDVVMLENLRFHKEEEENNPTFAQALAKHADYYVDDAFGAAHRAHASIDAITRFLPSASGMLMEKEIGELSKILKPQRPFICVMGGLKVSDKIKTIKHLAHLADKLLIGGAIANSFLKAAGRKIGKSKTDAVEIAEELLKQDHMKIVLPNDVVVLNDENRPETKQVDQICENDMIMDIGPKTRQMFKEEIRKARTLFWNGPLGVCERPEFASGTEEIAQYAAGLSSTRIVGGGDRVSEIMHLNIQEKFTYISTGGGAALEFLEGKGLPAITALERSYQQFWKQK